MIDANDLIKDKNIKIIRKRISGKYKSIINIGNCCRVHFVLKHLNLRRIKSPLDNMLINDFKIVNKLFKNKFLDFFSLENIIPLHEIRHEDLNGIIINRQMHDKNYDIYDNHNFFVEQNFEQSYNRMRKNFDSRIDDTLNELKNIDETFLLFAIDTYRIRNNEDRQYKIEQLNELENTFKEIYGIKYFMISFLVNEEKDPDKIEILSSNENSLIVSYPYVGDFKNGDYLIFEEMFGEVYLNKR